MNNILFVTEELFPFSKGGIGRLVYLEAIRLSQEGHQVKILFCGEDVNAKLLESFQFDVFFLPSSSELSSMSGEYTYDADNQVRHLSQRIAFFIRILNENGEIFDFIEFPDYLGLAFSTINAKRQGLIRKTQLISVRIHSTLFMLREFDSGWSVDMSRIYSMELFSIINADLVICHIKEVSNRVKIALESFGVVKLPKIFVSFPNVIDEHQRANLSNIGTFDFDKRVKIVFSSKIQPFKRPDIFIRAANQILSLLKSREVEIHLLARDPGGWFSIYAKKLIEKRYSQNYFLHHNEQTSFREEILYNSISVFPSEYESLCLAAFEAVASGSFPILNSRNPAFAGDDLWKHDVNCLKYDGSLENLVKCILQAIQRSKVFESPSLEFGPCPYCAICINEIAEIDASKISILIPHFEQAFFLEELLNYLDSVPCMEVIGEILILDDGSQESTVATLQTLIDSLRHSGTFRLIRNLANSGLAATRNRLITEAKFDILYFLDADDFPGIDYLSNSVEVFRNPHITAFFGATFSIQNASDLEELHILDKLYVLGPTPFSTFPKNLASSSSFMIRKSSALEILFDETLSVYEDWDFLKKMSKKTLNFTVSDSPALYYRRRSQGMLSYTEDELKLYALDRIFSKGHGLIAGMQAFDSMIFDHTDLVASINGRATNFHFRRYLVLYRILMRISREFPFLERPVQKLIFFGKRKMT